MRGSTRHYIINKIARIILLPVVKIKFNFTCEKVKPKSKPYILLANHVCNYDPILVGLSFREVIYYVASDHLFRMGFVSKLLKFAISPIPRAKATTETRTVKEIFKRLRDGHNICIFAEGNSTFSGVTGYIPPSIGKLALKAGASLITYRIRGGYFSMPRWSHSTRKGMLHGELVYEYTPDELKSMTNDQINEAVEKDLYVNAYDDQEKNPVAYKGKRLAEHLEHALYCCPNCLRFSSLRSSDDRLTCDCGLDLRYTQYGYLEPFSNNSISSPFTKIYTWIDWQKGILEMRSKELMTNCEEPIFTDNEQTLIETQRARKNTSTITGTLRFYCDRFSITKPDGTSRVFMLDDISNMSVIIQMNLIFTTSDGITYELHSKKPISATKYLDLYRFLTGRAINV